jgi:hypothetical protein
MELNLRKTLYIIAVSNVIWAFKNKNAKWFRFFSISLTALTVCSFYADGAIRIAKEDWGRTHGHYAYYEQSIMGLCSIIYCD